MKKIKFAAIYILFVGIIFFIFNGFPTNTAENTVENNVPQQTDTKEPVKQSVITENPPTQDDSQCDYPFLSERLVSDDELQKYSQEELKLMRNEVFAKHGYIFKATDLNKHFSSKKWYRGLYDDTQIVYDKFLSDIEKQNLETIKRAEANKKSIKTANGRIISDDPYIDLGLPSKTLWANCNLGANKPWEYGDYYAWAETTPNKAKFVWDNYTKQKKIEGKSIAATKDDAAFVSSKGKSAMPTNEQKNELLNECTWEWTLLKGVAGMVATGKNGKSIFFPAGGSYFDSWDGTLQQKGETCFYWTSDCVGGEYFKSRAYCLIMSDNYAKYTDRNGDFCDGKLIRPVYKR